MAEVLGKFQFMEGSWKLPENDKVQVHLNLDPSNVYEQMKSKFLAMAAAAKASGKVIASLNWQAAQYTMGDHPADKLTKYLAQAAAYIWGEERVTKEWQSEFSTLTHAISIEARIHNKVCRYAHKFTEEFFNVSAEEEKAGFFEILKMMCQRLDVQGPMEFILLPKRNVMMAMENSPMDFSLTFNRTTSSYEYLKHVGYLEQLDWYWDNPELPFPRRLAWEGGFEPEKDFWFTNIQQGTSLWEIMNSKFQTGGFIGVEPHTGYSDSGRLMHTICPGLSAVVKLPCGCLNELKTEAAKMSVQAAIIHLNDRDHHNDVKREWTREEIADWLESLDVDLTLKDNSLNTEKEE